MLFGWRYQYYAQNFIETTDAKQQKQSVKIFIEKKVKFEKINFQINKLNSKDKLSKMLFSKNLIASTSEFKRLLKQNGVK